jgi:methyl-accepting chemotaxis protein
LEAKNAMTSEASAVGGMPRPEQQGGWWRNLRIGPKLSLGFGILVVLTFIGVAVSVLADSQSQRLISSTAEVRVPTALVADQAQANLLRMQADVNGYLALGDSQYRTSYQQDEAAFATNLRQLQALEPKLSAADRARLAKLQEAYNAWLQYPPRLFALRDDQLAREPAYNILATQGVKLAGEVLIDTSKLIDQQALRPASAEDISQLADMARFQGSFSAMLSGLRGYVTTRNRIFRSEYEANYDLNQQAWDRLQSDRARLDPVQQDLIGSIAGNRTAFLALPDQMFTILEGDHYREDLFLFRSQALPTSETMLQALGDLTGSQQQQLILEMEQGRQQLQSTITVILVCGSIVLLLALLTGILLYRGIAGPVRRLTDVAEQVKAGDLEVQAQVETGDEIGILAGTFNRMTAQLRQTLAQIRREKKRADDLLNVVIPIGVQLSDEKDFNRLLESMLVEAKHFCHARGGVLFLRNGEDCLEYMIVRDDRSGLELGGTSGREVPFKPLPMQQDNAGGAGLAVQAALAGQAVNLAEAVSGGDFNFLPVAASAAAITAPGDRAGAEAGADGECKEGSGQGDGKGQVASLLAIPLKNSAGQVAGVLQLSDAQDPESGQAVAFDPNLQQMMESFSSLAVAALEAYVREQGLKLEIQQLRIEIDEVKRQQQVREIVESDFFQNLQSKARAMRSRHAGAGPDTAQGAAA